MIIVPIAIVIMFLFVIWVFASEYGKQKEFNECLGCLGCLSLDILALWFLTKD